MSEAQALTAPVASSETMHATAASAHVPWPALGVLVAVCAVHLVLSLSVNEGQFNYTLDDSYIHLSLAENIARGHYGINLESPSAPSSTILWPFLLAPFARLPIATWIPLLLNVGFAILCLLTFSRVVRLTLPGPESRWVALGLTILLIPFTNMVGLVFTGMEHSLQQWLSAAIVLGLVMESRTGRVPGWLIAAVIAGPLVRYEMLALSLPAAALLAHRGHRRAAVGSTLTALLLMGLFSLYLHHLGLGLLPSSLSMKSRLSSEAAGLFGMYDGLKANLTTGSRGIVLGIGLVLMMTAVFRRDRPAAERALGIWGLAMLALHLTCGRVGMYSRYEIYAWSATALLLLYLHRRWLRSWTLGVGGWRAAVAGITLLVTVGWPYLDILTEMHFAAANIYEQSFQMHRFAVEHHRGPVLANDIGYLSFRNEHEVVDIWGLASTDIRRRRESAEDPGWLSEIAEAHAADLAMVFETWFDEVPERWEPVAKLYLGQRWVVVGGNCVTFFSLSPDATDRLRAQLREFAPTLPEGVRLDVIE